MVTVTNTWGKMITSRFNDILSKEKVTKEYFQRVRKIWSSELYTNNKVRSQNIFAIPVITPTFGIINRTKEKLNRPENYSHQ